MIEFAPMQKKESDMFRSSGSHFGRAREGKELLKEGKSLSEMTTPIDGPSKEYLFLQRKRYIKQVSNMNNESLVKELERIEKRVERALNSEMVGTSELEWRRIIVMDKMESSKLDDKNL